MNVRNLTIVSSSVCALFLISLVVSSSAAYTPPGGWNGTVAVGAKPIGAAYDSANGLVLVTDSGANRLSVLSSSKSPSVVATAVTGKDPFGVTATGSACNNVIAVANSGSGSVSLLEGSAPFKTIATINIPSVMKNSPKSVPYEIAYAKGWLYVADGAGQIDLINCKTDKLLGSVGLTPFSTAQGAIYDPVHQMVYISDPGYGIIWYFNLNSNAKTCAPPSPCYVSSVAGNYTADPSLFALGPKGVVYFSDSEDNSIREIVLVKGTPTIPATEFGNFYSKEFYEPLSMVYDPANGMLLVANNGGKFEATAVCVATISPFCTSSGIGAFKHYENGAARAFGIAYDATNGYAYVTNENSASISLLD